MESESLIVFEKKNNSAWLTLNRPKQKNALNKEMILQILSCLQSAKKDDEIKSIVLTGSGNAFCSGADLNQMVVKSKNELPLDGLYGEMFLKLLRYPKPIIAMVNGPAMAGGLGLVIASHLAIAGKNAFFATPEIKLGFFPFMVMSVLLRTIPRRYAMEMILTGEKVDSYKAKEIGLINKVVTEEQLKEETQKYLDIINKYSVNGLSDGLEAVACQETMSLDQAVVFLQQKLRDSLLRNDVKEKIEQFLVK